MMEPHESDLLEPDAKFDVSPDDKPVQANRDEISPLHSYFSVHMPRLQYCRELEKMNNLIGIR